MYYIYGHYKPNEDRPFYVGKGLFKRVYQKTGRSKYWINIVNKYFPETKFPIVKILSRTADETEAFGLEKFWIALHGRKSVHPGGCLINNTGGGEGAAGAIRSRSTKIKLSFNKKKFYRNPNNVIANSRFQGFEGCWLYHVDGRKEWCETINGFARKYNINNTWLQQVVRGKGNHCSQWYADPSKIKKQWTLVHPEHGIHSFYNQLEFARRWKLNPSHISQVLQQKRPSHKQWKLYND